MNTASSTTCPSPSDAHRQAAVCLAPEEEAANAENCRPRTIYDRVFWIAYAANLLLVTGNAMTFRFAELIARLGGTEEQAGAVVSFGMIGALAARVFLGPAIDRYGVRRLWVFGGVLFIGGCLGFVFCQSLDWTIYAARVAFAAGLAGMFTCSMVHIQNHVPEARRTEVIGNLGSSGFLGMMLGTQLGDVIFRAVPAGQTRFVILFGSAAALGLVYVVLVTGLTKGMTHCRPRETPNALRLLFRYWPGNVVLVALMIGVSLSVTTVFLTRFATERGLGGIGVFFAVYSTSAFVFRIVGSKWNRTIGRHRMNLAGLCGHAVGHLLLIGVTTQAGFFLPAVCCGFGHAMLFPAVVSLVAGAFPVTYRGTGTTLALGLTELGILIASPILGRVIDQAGFPAMFIASASAAAVIAVVYAVTAARGPDSDLQPAAETS